MSRSRELKLIDALLNAPELIGSNNLALVVIIDDLVMAIEDDVLLLVVVQENRRLVELVDLVYRVQDGTSRAADEPNDAVEAYEDLLGVDGDDLVLDEERLLRFAHLAPRPTVVELEVVLVYYRALFGYHVNVLVVHEHVRDVVVEFGVF